MQLEYRSTGLVWGNFWGSGQGGYPASPLGPYDTKEELLAEANKQLESGALDSGMGYESLIGAVLVIRQRRTVLVEGEAFHATVNDITAIGNLTDPIYEFLEERLEY